MSVESPSEGDDDLVQEPRTKRPRGHDTLVLSDPQQVRRKIGVLVRGRNCCLYGFARCRVQPHDQLSREALGLAGDTAPLYATYTLESKLGQGKIIPGALCVDSSDRHVEELREGFEDIVACFPLDTRGFKRTVRSTLPPPTKRKISEVGKLFRVGARSGDIELSKHAIKRFGPIARRAQQQILWLRQSTFIKDKSTQQQAALATLEACANSLDVGEGMLDVQGLHKKRQHELLIRLDAVSCCLSRCALPRDLEDLSIHLSPDASPKLSKEVLGCVVETFFQGKPETRSEERLVGATLNHGVQSAGHKISGLLFQVWLQFGQPSMRFKKVRMQVRSITSEFGVERLIGARRMTV